ncbi:hypothetical protein [Streptomyces sp. ISL-100]|uniref:hypothetical protein n=1 Tax=Streptomyces sp. ISL-100 TaxID=2819173 RepID=UPI001BE9F0C9|nr:hypothetical protein [Streptomyces sp. ISL-100]MBT2397247.1 hypothetical protein [Streptomyces sp. ISL-100]
MSALLGMLLAVAVLLMCTDTGAGGAPAAGAPVEAGAVVAPGAFPSPEEREPGCSERHGDGVGSVPAAPGRGGAAYELLPALYDARAGAGSWGADAVVPDLAPDHWPPPVAPPTPMDLSILRV